MSDQTESWPSDATVVQPILDAIDGLVAVLDRAGRLVTYNRACEVVTGVATDDARGRPIWDVFLTADQRVPAREAFERGIREGFTGRFVGRVRSKTGDERIVRWSGASLRRGSDGETVVVATGEDVTARWRAEEALRASEQQYRVLFECNPQPMWVYDRETLAFLEVNDAAVATYGYSREQFLSMTIKDIRPAEDVPDLLELVARADDGLRRNGVWRHRRADGSTIVVEVSGFPIEFGGRSAILVLALDVTERVATMRAIAESEERYREIFEADLTGNYISTPTGRILACNATFARIFGYESAEEASHASTLDMYEDPAAREEFLEHLRTRGRVVRQEVVLRRRDGSDLHAVESAVATLDASGDLVRINGFVYDNSHHKLLEEHYVRAQKMEAIGRLAGGIAHDFNNVLTVIASYGEFIARRIPPADPMLDDVKQIQSACRRASELTKQLLAFGRRQVLRPKSIDLDGVVRDIERIIRALAGAEVEVVVARDPNLWPVKADPSQVEQVVMNLVANARDAMPRGGTLTVATANEVVGEDVMTEHGAIEPGEYVVLTVADTGSGMDVATRARVFEPFFTTKDVGQGSGLGLATVYGIVKQSGGSIWVVSAPDEGTTIRVFLPRTDERPLRETVKPPPAAASGTETVLLVEDDDVVRALAAQALGLAGFLVLIAADGTEALAKLSSLGGRLDVLVTDVVMPGMNGREVARHVLELRPGTRVLYMSGFAGESIFERGVLDRGAAFLEKPFTPAVLVAKVREVLDRPVA